ncbi:hypothetical protein AC579_3690 [Pseudocercospora musae]|uniref:Rhodopsin domain-containing protein n=1 Tax=Pseudocercospora musae TaxID=113226 RepID=A0A139IJ86_9PEZI|nr:hypothetical protein AC579_3690 [Pseudocercospora musae]KXT14633.1 hypothetical protein AC579_3690 [Pseudocercospora musae]KXT14634.1 hypothetical protein AC579_3690 [Pseudocercospora musae]
MVAQRQRCLYTAEQCIREATGTALPRASSAHLRRRLKSLVKIRQASPSTFTLCCQPRAVPSRTVDKLELRVLSLKSFQDLTVLHVVGVSRVAVFNILTPSITHPRPHRVNMPQREGYENAVTYTISLCLVFTICVGLVRAWIRRNAYGRDDVVIGLATLLSFGYTGASYAAVAAGLGKPWSRIKADPDLAELNEASIAGIILFLLALYLSKCAMVAFLSRITKAPEQIRLYHICNGFVGLIGLASTIIATASCHVSSASGYYWAFSDNVDTCPSQNARWQAITGLDIFSEILLLLLPLHLVWNLQMRLSKKAMIIVAFWIRIPTLAFSIGRNYYTMRLRHQSSDNGLDSSLVNIWLDIELAYAIASSTLSALKTFTESFASGFGMGFTRGKGDDSYGMSNVSGSSGRSSSRTEKSKSPKSSGARGSIGRYTERPKGVEDCLPPLPDVATDTGLRLRPETDISHIASVSANPQNCEIWRANSSVGSESSGDDHNLVIVRRSYEVHEHDRAPILPHREVRA